MEKTKVGSIRYIDTYLDAPQNAKYILRKLTDGSVRLQFYTKRWANTLADFSPEAYREENFHQTLSMCREVVGDNSTIYVEKPSFMYHRGLD